MKYIFIHAKKDVTREKNDGMKNLIEQRKYSAKKFNRMNLLMYKKILTFK